MVYKASDTPPRKVVQNGKFANDGTGDTLRDAADKINDNFAQLWYDIYTPPTSRPGREFTHGATGDSYSPDSGQFTLTDLDLSLDSYTNVIKFSAYDQLGKGYKFESESTISPVTLSIWEVDSADIDEFRLKAITTGTVNYIDSVGHWEFTQSSISANAGALDSGATYHFSLQNVW